MGLPDARNRTYAALAAVKAVDLNDLQDTAIVHNRKLLGHGVLGTRAQVLDGYESVPSGSYLFAAGNAGAPYLSGAITSKNRGRTIAQYVSGELLFYELADDELATTHANGDATNPRWDIVCVKLAKTAGGGTVTLTKSVVAGTPAGSPVEPATPAGYVKLAAVRIPANQTSGSSALVPLTDLRDYRMPFGVHIEEAIPRRGDFTTYYSGGSPVAAWTPGVAGELESTANGDTQLIMPRGPGRWDSARLIGFGLLYDIAASGSIEVLLGRLDAEIDVFTSVKDISSTFPQNTAVIYHQADLRSAAPPIWLDGSACGAARGNPADGALAYSQLAIRIRNLSTHAAGLQRARLIWAGTP